MPRSLLVLALLLSGCGAHSAPTAARQVGGPVASQSLATDVLGMVGPYAAKKALQVAIAAALKKDAASQAAWAKDVSHQPEATQIDFLKKRLGALQKAGMAAEVAMLPMQGIDAAHAALDAMKADDGQHAKLADPSPAGLLAWADALAGDLAALKAAF